MLALAVDSAALLLQSANEKHPNGLANSSGLVGRNYMVHNNTALMAVSPTRTILTKQGFTNTYVGSETLVLKKGAKVYYQYYVQKDGQDIREVTQQSLRAAIGIVPQDTVLFNDTLLENIRFGRPGASDADVQEAVRMAHLADFVAQLPQGRQFAVVVTPQRNGSFTTVKDG